MHQIALPVPHVVEDHVLGLSLGFSKVGKRHLHPLRGNSFAATEYNLLHIV